MERDASKKKRGGGGVDGAIEGERKSIVAGREWGEGEEQRSTPHKGKDKKLSTKTNHYHGKQRII